VFFQAQGRADLLVRFADEVGFYFVPEELAIFDSVAPNAFGVDESQQTLNCALSVDLL
jgi:hypothetical protein